MERVKWWKFELTAKKGMSFAEISLKYHLDPRTAKKYALSETRPVYKLSQIKPSKLDPYKQQMCVTRRNAI